MTEPQKHPPTSRESEASESTPLMRGGAFERAADSGEAGNADSAKRSRDTLSATEGIGAALPDSTDGSDAISRRHTGEEHDDDEKLDHDLEDKALVDGVDAAHETAQIVQALTPHSF